MDNLDRRVLRMRAVNAAEHTRSLAAQEPEWASEVHSLAGGWLVLAGAGMYVNQAMAAGIDVALTAADLELIESRSEHAGVAPAIEVTSSTLPESLRLIGERGFVHDTQSDIACLARPVADVAIDAPVEIAIRSVETPADMRLWQEISATGWGHTTTGARRAADAFAAAACALDNEHMIVALDPGDGRPLGCATMTVRDNLAMLGGMSTIPAERSRGVQAALLRYRLTEAGRMGCDLAMATAASGSGSARNLRRHGFSLRYTIQRFSRPATG